MTLPGEPLRSLEDRWERSIEAPRVTADAVARWLAPWPHLVGEPITVLAGGLRALTLRVGELHVLRVALSPDEDLACHAAILRAMEGVVRVPPLLSASTEALLFAFVSHGPLRDDPLDGEKVGRAAARVHARAFSSSGFLDPTLRVPKPFASAYDGARDWVETAFCGAAGRTLGPRVDLLRRAWAAAEPDLRDATARPVLVHGDFKPTNVRRAIDGEPIFFDWEFAWAGAALSDLGQMLRWGPSNGFVDAMAHGYVAGGGHLPPHWRNLAALLDLFALVGLLDHPAPMPVRDADLLARIDATLHRGVGGCPR